MGGDGSWFTFAAHDAAARRTLAERFARADPFPHLVLDDVLTARPDEIGPFPDADWPGWTTFGDRYQAGKRYCQDIEVMPEPFRSMLDELGRPSTLRFLEEVTGIDKLVSDPYLEGGGMHCSGPGGVLLPHTDFHLYPNLDLYRRINLLLYLNPGWPVDGGGELQLHRKGDDEPTVVVAPTFGRCVVFRTDDRSVHGFPNPVADGLTRSSLATYYYTSRDDGTFSGDTSTHWQTVPGSGPAERVRVGAYRALIFGSRGLAFVAHRIDPNLASRKGQRRRH